MSIVPVDPSGSTTRRWRCNCCGKADALDNLRKTDCSYVHPPCKYCGQTPECAADCAGIMTILASPDVHVVGMTKPKLPKA